MTNSPNDHISTTTATGAAVAAAERESIRPQLIGVWALGIVGSLAVIAIIVLGERTKISAAAFSTLGAIAAAAVGGIAGMLTSTKSTTTSTPPPGGSSGPPGPPGGSSTQIPQVADDEKEPRDPESRIPGNAKKPNQLPDGKQIDTPAVTPALGGPADSPQAIKSPETPV